MENAMVESAHAQNKTRARSEPWWRLLKRSSSYWRLQQCLASYRIELDEAEQALAVNNVELGWRRFKAAMCMELYGLSSLPDQSAHRARAHIIFCGTMDGLSSWRKHVVEDLLGKNGELIDKAPVEYVVCIAQPLDEKQDNEY